MEVLGLLLGLLLVCTLGVSVWADFSEPPEDASLRSLAEGPTRLPCLFKPDDGEQVVQVTWFKVSADGNKEQIITAHHSEGSTEFGRFSGRVTFDSTEPIKNSALVIRSTEMSDEGQYVCHISTFPSGNFEIKMSLTVWTTPISSIDPVEMEEGQSYRVAATCRSVARPPPRISWDTDLSGQSQNRSSDAGTVSSQFLLHPMRKKNGEKLDCLVWHPSQEQPRRFSNRLVVYYPPDVSIRRRDDSWHVGLEQASLQCESGGNPKPQLSWIRNGKPLPEGVVSTNGSLIFRRPLTLDDAGLYQCIARNRVGEDRAEVEVKVSEFEIRKTSFNSVLMMIIGVVVGVLLVILVIAVVLVNMYHKRKNRKLEKELCEKKEEISTLSRQASIRRINSASPDARLQEECIPLRVEGTIRSSLSSLGEQGRCRDSRSTLSGGRSAVDHLGRPVLYTSYRRGERGRPREAEQEGENSDSLRRVESYVQDNSLFLDATLHPPLRPSPPSYQHTADLLRPINGNAVLLGGGRQDSQLHARYPVLTDEEEDEKECQSMVEKREDECDLDSEANSSQISEAMSQNFQYHNGTLRPKLQPNSIVIHPKSHIV